MATKKPRPPIHHQLPVPIEVIERRIFLIRGKKMMFDRHIAELYEVKPIALRQQVKRNPERSPPTSCVSYRGRNRSWYHKM